MPRLKNWLRQWQRLEPWEKSVLRSLAWRLPVVWLALRVLGFKRFNNFTEQVRQRSGRGISPQTLSPAQYAQRSAELCRIAAVHGLYQANCLHQSLALKYFLRSKGIKAVMRIGMKPDQEIFEAHAWVEFEGENLGGAIDEYVAFENLCR